MSELSNVISAAIAALITGSITLAGVWLTNYHNREQLKLQLETNRDNEKIIRQIERAEELYVLTDKWVSALGVYSLNVMRVMKGDLTYNQCLDLQIESGNQKEYNFSRIEMIVDIHFKDLKKAYQEILEARAELNEIVFQHKAEYENGETYGEQHMEPCAKAQGNIERAGEDFKNLIAEKTKNA